MSKLEERNPKSEVNVEALRKWVLALVSGEYKQGKGVLRRGDKYCCLGVACEIFKDEVGLKEDGQPVWPATRFVGTDGDASAVELPESLAKFMFGNREIVNPDVARPSSDGVERTLATFANDDLGWSFEQIARSVNDYYELGLELD